MYYLAFQHKSLKEDVSANNERLEYLGDSVLNLVVTDYLFRRFPYKEEGFLTEMRSKIVSREQLNEVAKDMGLEHLLSYSTGINVHKSSVLGDALEAVIGSLYLDKGFKMTQKMIVNEILQKHIDIKKIQNEEVNYKGRLIEWAQKTRRQLTFEVVDKQKVGRATMFKVEIMIDGKPKGSAVATSKKVAEQKASAEVFKVLNLSEFFR